MAFSDWSTVAADNGTMPGINWAEGMLPSAINNSARQMMADLAFLKGNGGAALIGTSGGISVEAEFVIQQTAISLMAGTITSGRLGYTTYALLAANTSAPAGSLAEVPISDAGTHTDPVVGGTVFNSGIFRWSASPAGWQWLYPTDAASGKPYADAAQANAVLSQTYSNISASYATLLNYALPYKLGNLRTLHQESSTFSSGGGYVLAANASSGGIYHITSEDKDSRDAGLLFTVKIPVTAGALVSAALTQRNAANTVIVASTPMTVENGYAILRGITLNAATTNLLVSVTATGAGATIEDIGVATGEPSAVITDPMLLARAGVEQDTNNANPFILPTAYNVNTLGGAAGTFNSQNGGIAPLTFQGYLIALFPGIVTGNVYTLSFLGDNIPPGAAIYPYVDESSIHVPNVWTDSPLPALRKVGARLYECTFHANAGFPILGVAIFLNNIAPATQTALVSDFKLVAGTAVPSTRTPPLTIQATAAKNARNYMIAGATKKLTADRTLFGITGSSICAGYAGPLGTQTNIGIQLQARIGSKATVINNAVRGTQTAVMLAKWNSSPANITFPGGSIPTTTTPVAITLDNDKLFNAFSNTDGMTEPMGITVAGVHGFITVTRVSGNITGYTFTRSVAGDAVAAGTVPLLTDQGEAARNMIQFIEPGRNDEFSPYLITRDMLPEYIMDFIERQIDYSFPRFKQLIVALPFVATNDTDYVARLASNARLTSLLPCPYFDLTAPPNTEELTYLATLGYTPSSQDIIDMANGLFPRGLRVDQLHQNLLGNKCHAYRLEKLLTTTLGWIY